jgi:hypothetical protein
MQSRPVQGFLTMGARGMEPRTPLFAPDGYRHRVAIQPSAQDLLPGAELVERGLSDLMDGTETVESLLVSIGAPRLRDLGFDVRSPFSGAEGRLYLLLARDDPDGAHSRYNGLVRRLVSFERALECGR